MATVFSYRASILPFAAHYFRKRDGSEAVAPSHQFGFNYGAEPTEQEQEVGQLIDRELTALEQENILDHLDDLSTRDRDVLDSIGAEFYIKDYYRLLRRAKADEDARVDQLKMTAVVSTEYEMS